MTLPSVPAYLPSLNRYSRTTSHRRRSTSSLLPNITRDRGTLVKRLTAALAASIDMADMFATGLHAARLSLCMAVLDAEVVQAGTCAAVGVAGDEVDGSGVWSLDWRDNEGGDHVGDEDEDEGGEMHGGGVVDTVAFCRCCRCCRCCCYCRGCCCCGVVEATVEQMCVITEASGWRTCTENECGGNEKVDESRVL